MQLFSKSFLKYFAMSIFAGSFFVKSFFATSVYAESPALVHPDQPVGSDLLGVRSRAAFPEQRVYFRGARAVLLVGDVDGDKGRATQGYIKNMREVATMLRSRGVTVHEFYSPDTKWDVIKSVAQGAHFIIYAGHGVGTNLKPPYIQKEVGGFYFKNVVSSTEIKEDIKPARGAIIMFLGACFTAGNMNYDMGKINEDEAKKRIAMYSEPFLKSNFAGYYATWSPEQAKGILAQLFHGATLEESYKNVTDKNIVSIKHPRSKNNTLIYHRGEREGHTIYDYAFAGESNSTLASLFQSMLLTSDKVKLSEADTKKLTREAVVSIYDGNEETAVALLRNGADPEGEYAGWKIIHLAIYFDMPAVVEELLKQNVTLYHTVNGYTPLALSETYKRKKITKMLLNAGAVRTRAFSFDEPPAPQPLLR